MTMLALERIQQTIIHAKQLTVMEGGSSSKKKKKTTCLLQYRCVWKKFTCLESLHLCGVTLKNLLSDVPTYIATSDTIQRSLVSLTITNYIEDGSVQLQSNFTLVSSILQLLPNLKRVFMPHYNLVAEPLPFEPCPNLEELHVKILDLYTTTTTTTTTTQSDRIMLFPKLRSLTIDRVFSDTPLRRSGTHCDLQTLVTQFPRVNTWDILLDLPKLGPFVVHSLLHVTHLTLRITSAFSKVDLTSLHQLENLVFLKIANRSSPILLPIMKSVKEYTYVSYRTRPWWKNEESGRTAFPNLETLCYTSTNNGGFFESGIGIFDDMPHLKHIDMTTNRFPSSWLEEVVSAKGRRTWPALTHISTFTFPICLVGATNKTLATLFGSERVESIVSADTAKRWNDCLLPFRLSLS